MKDAQSPAHVGLNRLLTHIQDGRYEIPEFQRAFVWYPWEIRDLMRSIFLDYYIGTLLLWKGNNDNFQTLSCEPIQGFAGSRRQREYIVLDGQQRLSAMHYAFMAPDLKAPHRANRYLYFIRVDRFLTEAYDEAFVYDWTGAGRNLVSDHEEQYRRHYFPLSTIGQQDWALYKWFDGYEKYWESENARYTDAGNATKAAEAAQITTGAEAFREHIMDVYNHYQVTYIELDRDIEIDKVCDIFQKINSTGQPLDIFDLLNAILRPKEVHLRHLWEEASDRVSFVAARRMNIYVLQVMSILAQAGLCSPKYLYYLVPGQRRKLRQSDGTHEYRVHVKDTDDFNERWNVAVEAIEASIARLRSQYGVVGSKFLPYPSIVPAFAGIQARAKTRADAEQIDAQKKIACWYWSSVFSSRYSNAVESTAAGDYRDVGRWFRDDSAEPSVIREFRSSLTSLDLKRETSTTSAVYRGVLNLAVLEGAKDWYDTSSPSESDRDDHHIVPKGPGRALGLGSRVDSVLNRTPLSANTNRRIIRDRLPNEYLPELIETNGEAAVREILESHLISAEAFSLLLEKNFTADHFEAFLEERQRTVRRAMEQLLPEGLGPLPRPLRILNTEVESAELSLRALVAEALDGDSRLVPTNVLGPVRQRIGREIERNPSLDLGREWTLAERLEYFDLRELERTITSKAVWPRFAPTFRSKGEVGTRFTQLTDLRNSIRHSRTVTAQAVKDAEAALHWFSNTLARTAEAE